MVESTGKKEMLHLYSKYEPSVLPFDTTGGKFIAVLNIVKGKLYGINVSFNVIFVRVENKKMKYYF